MKRTENIGDGLFLVEGINKWALYDLFGQAIRVIDPGTANYLVQIAQSSAEICEKLEYLLRETPEIHGNCVEGGILGRMFLPDTSEAQAKLDVLDIAWVEITGACNEKCIHCYAESGPVRSRGMSVETARRVLDQLKSAKFRKCQIVGGEPLVHKGFWEILEYARSLGFEELEVFSNATLFRKDDLERLSGMGVSLATSVFGHTEEIHDACTKTPGSFRKWLKNLREAKRLGIPFRIGLVRMRQNEAHMDEVRDFLLSENFIEDPSQFGFDDVRESGRGTDVSIAQHSSGKGIARRSSPLRLRPFRLISGGLVPPFFCLFDEIRKVFPSGFEIRSPEGKEKFFDFHEAPVSRIFEIFPLSVEPDTGFVIGCELDDRVGYVGRVVGRRYVQELVGKIDGRIIFKIFRMSPNDRRIVHGKAVSEFRMSKEYPHAFGILRHFDSEGFKEPENRPFVFRPLLRYEIPVFRYFVFKSFEAGIFLESFEFFHSHRGGRGNVVSVEAVFSASRKKIENLGGFFPNGVRKIRPPFERLVRLRHVDCMEERVRRIGFEREDHGLAVEKIRFKFFRASRCAATPIRYR